MYTKLWKVFGITDGLGHTHRQRESFNSSWFEFINDWSHLTVINSDITGTNNYSVVVITAHNENECDSLFSGQLSDGVFENSRVGLIESYVKGGNGKWVMQDWI